MSPPISIVFGSWDNAAPATKSSVDPESRQLKSDALSGKSWTPSLSGWIRRQQRGGSPTKSRAENAVTSNLRRAAMFQRKREELKLRQDRVAHLEALRAKGPDPKLPPPIRAPVSPIKARPAQKALEHLNEAQEEARVRRKWPALEAITVPVVQIVALVVFQLSLFGKRAFVLTSTNATSNSQCTSFNTDLNTSLNAPF
ncbi:hypothetical protein C8J57DRAFT_1507666 [Mycena rebaudengoi]|nr:hypothetical protein C8J57DRAFT_1507666 [Mycena rebaudengoi]